jgi:hypothetical protein
LIDGDRGNPLEIDVGAWKRRGGGEEKNSWEQE